MADSDHDHDHDHHHHQEHPLRDLLTQRFVMLFAVIIIVGGMMFMELMMPEQGINIIMGILIGAGVLEGGNRFDGNDDEELTPE